jgi:hypothetical protein
MPIPYGHGSGGSRCAGALGGADRASATQGGAMALPRFPS